LRLAVKVEIGDAHGSGAGDLLVELRDREAALLVGRELLRRPQEARVDEYARLLGRILLGEVHGNHPLRDADLHLGEPDARGFVHGLKHIVDERAYALVDGLYRLGDEAQSFVRKSEDIA